MAITILNEPTSPNVTGTNLIYTISSSNIVNFQYRYVADIYEKGSSTRLARFKYPQNEFGTLNSDLARPLDDYLDYDYNWKITNSSSLDNSNKSFDIKFGEEFATSYTGATTVYPNLATTEIEVIKGNVYPNEFTYGFNWDSGSVLLTNSPATQSFSADDYLTTAVYNSDVTVNYYLTGSLTATKNYVSNGDFSAIPISPLNISNYTESDVITLDVTGSSIRYEVDNDCRNDKQRIAFINKFGVWDYYTNHTALRRSTKIDRRTYEESFANLNDRVTTYNVNKRGELQYYTEYTDEFEFTTDSITAETSQWLREMFESSEVYLQSGSNMIPINILNKKETVINDTPRNKNYQYTVRYQFSNLREPR
jgi:hypothetical protein